MTNHSQKLVTISPLSNLRGDFKLPGDKSISHRSAMFAALGTGTSRIRNYSSARDCQSTLDCLEALGVAIKRDAEIITIAGVGLDGLQAPTRLLDVGNSGTTIRLLAGILAGQKFTTEITGDESIQRRPMKRVIEPLQLLGTQIAARDNNFAPLKIQGGNLKGIDYTPPIASAQVKSCVLLAGLFAEGETAVIETTPTRNHTEIMLRECGVPLNIHPTEAGNRISLAGGHPLNALDHSNHNSRHDLGGFCRPFTRYRLYWRCCAVVYSSYGIVGYLALVTRFSFRCEREFTQGGNVLLAHHYVFSDLGHRPGGLDSRYRRPGLHRGRSGV